MGSTTVKTKAPIARIASLLFVAIVFLIPWQTRWIGIEGSLNNGPWEYGTVSIYALDILIAAFALFSLVHLLVEKRSFTSSPRQLTALFLLAVAFFSMAFADNTINALFWWIKLAEGIAIFLLVSQVKPPWHWIGGAFLLSGVIQSGLALTQFFTQRVVGSKWLGMSSQLPEIPGVQVVGTATERFLRAYGALPHPNMLGGLLVVTILVTLLIYSSHKPIASRVPYGVSLAILGAGLWTTFSRQAWLALVLALVVLITYTFITERTFPKSIAAGLSFILLPMITLSLIMPDLIQTRLTTDTSTESRSITERQDYAKQSAELIRGDWVNGVGIGNYTAAIHTKDQNNNIEKLSSAYQPVHNIYLLVFAELGVFGLFGFLIFLLANTRGLSWKQPWTLGLSLAVIALLTIAFFDHYLWTLHFGILLFWITFSLLEYSRE